jgi:hypothetical protein
MEEKSLLNSAFKGELRMPLTLFMQPWGVTNRGNGGWRNIRWAHEEFFAAA